MRPSFLTEWSPYFTIKSSSRKPITCIIALWITKCVRKGICQNVPVLFFFFFLIHKSSKAENRRWGKTLIHLLHFHSDRKIQHCKTQTDLVCTVCQTLLQNGLDLLYISGSRWRHVTTLPHFREVWHANGEKVAKITAISTLKTGLCCHPNERCMQSKWWWRC